MARRINRAFVLLDQASGGVRTEEEAVIGLDLRPDVETAADAAGIEITIGVPGLGGAELAAPPDLSSFAGGRRVVALPAIDYGPDDLSELSDLQGDEPPAGFIAADRKLRGEAKAAGMVPAPHAALLPMMAAGEDILAARASGPRGGLERLAAKGGIVPMHFQPVPGASTDWALIGLFTQDALVTAVLDRLSVTPLDYDAMTDDLVWARIDESSEEVRAALKPRKILYAEPGQVLIALQPGENAEALHIHGSHGHSELLMPDPGLMQGPAGPDDAFFMGEGPIVRERDIIIEPVEHPLWKVRILRWIRPYCADVTSEYENDLARYTGTAPLDSQGTIVSRHSAHPDNKRAETALLNDLHAMGYCAHRHTFTHAGATHSNIIADLPGAGHARIRPEILKRYREILQQPVIDRNALGEAAEGAFYDVIRDIPDKVLRKRVEEILVLRPWYPWWKKLCPIPGIGAELVIVGAHMDSTAGFEAVYNPATDPAPGCDDNGSGTAGVLSLARYFADWNGRLTHTLRFCLFNAEESGLVGSKAYASHLKAMGAPIRAVYCTDMMGFNSDANRLFELHAGYTDPAIRDLSVPLAQEVAAAAASYGKLSPAQIYQGTGYGGAPDRTVYDGAINRSDHAAFHQQGYPAILGSEDFFINLGTEPGADPNPNYHRQSDTVVDTSYAKDIVCAFAKAIKDKAL